jgi:hypothetical protein
MMARGAEGVEEMESIFVTMARRAPSPPRWGRKQNHDLGFSQVIDFAREGVTYGDISPARGEIGGCPDRFCQGTG